MSQTTKPRRKKKAKQFVTILTVAKAMKKFVTEPDRQLIGKAWFELYQKKRKNDKARYPWVGKVREGKHEVRAYSLAFKSEIERFIKLYFQIEKSGRKKI